MDADATVVTRSDLKNLFDRFNQCITLFVSADGDAKMLINPR
jgi:hypothetical protein